MASVLVPVFYLLAVFGGLFVFGRYYTSRHANKTVDPFFPRHVERDTYVTLLGLDPPAPDALLKAALIRRAVTDVHRILRIREDKPAMQQLLQKGLVGDDLWNSLLAAEKELEAEILEVQAEANTFVDGWGGVIFTTAGEMVNTKKVHAVFEGMTQMRADFAARYGKKSDANAPAPAPSTPARQPAPLNPSTSVPSTPKSPDSLAPPNSADSVLSSDGEGPRSPASPSKSASKKSKKRK